MKLQDKQLTKLIQNSRLLTLPLAAGDLHSLLPDEDGRRLYVAMKDNLLSTSLDDITQNPRKLYWPASPDRVQECLMAGKEPEMPVVQVAPLSETDNPEDDKGLCVASQLRKRRAAEVLYSGCTNDIGGQRSLVNKWSTFRGSYGVFSPGQAAYRHC
ncbi:semaphorin-3ab-like isoform X1 [Lates japonicus]|uniref:Semaphorin-3ab-like isoform X1 n=1 Tax=Lates japonicus TaxID=270547 RepID=A0AAD3M1U3_LATJO|nr:semaphorin-3ab-like isoform X1 [Lates japonicus]